MPGERYEGYDDRLESELVPGSINEPAPLPPEGEQPAQPESNTRPLVSKKKGLLRAVVGAVAVGAAALGGYQQGKEHERENFEAVQAQDRITEKHVKQAVQEEYGRIAKELRSRYEQTAELPSLDIRTELILGHDLVVYIERDTSSRKMFGAEIKVKYHELTQKVLQEALAPQQKPEKPLTALPRSHALEVLLRLKTALQKNIGTTYNQENDTMVDPLVHGKYQCRSGTLSLILMALEAQQRDPALFAGGETLVEIYTEGHVEPGLLLKDGTLIAIEMTSAGPGVRNFGNYKAIKSPIQVVRADHATYQDALSTKAHRDKAMMLDNAPKRVPTFPVGKKGNSQFGFGMPKAPEGDQAMSSARMLPAEGVFDPNNLTARIEQTKGDQDILRDITNPQDKAFVQNYLIHHRFILSYFNPCNLLYRDIMTRINKEEFATREEVLQVVGVITRSADILEQYIIANDLDPQCKQTKDLFKQYYGNKMGLTLGSPSTVVEDMREGIRKLKLRIPQLSKDKK